MIGLEPTLAVTGLSLSADEEQKEWCEDKRSTSGWIHSRLHHTSWASYHSDKTQGNSKRMLHLFFGLGMAVINWNYLIYSDLKMTLGFTASSTHFSGHYLFFMLQLMLHRRQTYSVTSSFDHIFLRSSNWNFLVLPQDPMAVTSCFLLLLHLFLQNLKHAFLIYETQNEALDKDPYNPGCM